MRQGRELEQLVECMEKALSSSGAVVTSPDRIPDRDTGELREVDISVRQQVGSVSVLVIVECRDRGRPQDVTWIEQVAEKRNSVLAARAVAVSPRGFSRGAVQKAKALGVELRQLTALSAHDIVLWLRVEQVVLFEAHSDIVEVAPVLDPQTTEQKRAATDFFAGLGEGGERSGSLLRMPDRVKLVPNQLWDEACRSIDPHLTIPEDGTRVRRSLELRMRVPFSLFLQAESALVPIRSVTITADVWYEKRQVPLNRMMGYRSDSEIFAQTAEYLVECSGRTEVMSITTDLRSGHASISRRPLPPDDELAEMSVRVKLGPRP